MFRRNQRTRLTVLAATLVAVVLGLAAVISPISGLVQRATAWLAGPIHAGGATVAGLFGGRGGCQADSALQSRVEALTIENAQLKTLESENESLKRSLNFLDGFGDQAVPARVIYESDDGISRTLVLNRGAADGLAVGQPVVAGDGVIVGKVSAVRRATAAVMPLTDARSRLAVTVQNSQETIGVLEGDRGLSLIMNLVPQTETLAVGQAVITSGLEPGIRRGLIVGSIDRIDRPPREPFQSATVSQFAAWKHPLFVTVLKEAADSPAVSSDDSAEEPDQFESGPVQEGGGSG